MRRRRHGASRSLRQWRRSWARIGSTTRPPASSKSCDTNLLRPHPAARPVNLRRLLGAVRRPQCADGGRGRDPPSGPPRMVSLACHARRTSPRGSPAWSGEGPPPARGGLHHPVPGHGQRDPLLHPGPRRPPDRGRAVDPALSPAPLQQRNQRAFGRLKRTSGLSRRVRRNGHSVRHRCRTRGAALADASAVWSRPQRERAQNPSRMPGLPHQPCHSDRARPRAAHVGPVRPPADGCPVLSPRVGLGAHVWLGAATGWRPPCGSSSWAPGSAG
jgi:hypothetical protein